MIRIAVVEDDPHYQKQLIGFIQDYQTQQNVSLQVTAFSDGLELVEHYHSNFDIIFLDIQMKLMDGMEAARRIRKVDQTVVLIFITNLAQFALQGYEVEALNYILKPINRFAFAQELSKAIRKASEKQAGLYLHVVQKNGMLRLDADRITYVESQGNDVIYHTLDGDYSARDSLKCVEEKLHGRPFYRCNNCYLVNLAQVEQVHKNQNTLMVGGAELQISRPRKKGFLAALTAYVGGK